jgi:hypothetical protein
MPWHNIHARTDYLWQADRFFSNWAVLLTMKYLAEMTNEQTMAMYSCGHQWDYFHP